MTVLVRKRDQVAGLIRARIADGSLRPGMLAPSGVELAKELGFAPMTCKAALRILLDEGALTRVSRTARPRVAGDGPGGDGAELAVGLAQAMAALRHAAGVTQLELAAALGMSVTAVCHAETGRLWHGRRFWEKTDVALGAGGGLLDRYDAWQEALALEAAAELLARCDASQAAPAADGDKGSGTPIIGHGRDAAVPDVLATPVEPGVPDSVVITLPCDPMSVTVRWADGSVTTVQPGPSSG